MTIFNRSTQTHRTVSCNFVKRSRTSVQKPSDGKVKATLALAVVRTCKLTQDYNHLNRKTSSRQNVFY